MDAPYLVALAVYKKILDIFREHEIMNIMTTENYNNFKPMAVAELLNGKYSFVIPSFQRGFRWEKKQITDLLEDIDRFSKEKDSKVYYLQPIVVKKQPIAAKEDREKWEVLDGQQRLTTIKLILDSFKDRVAPDFAKKLKENIYELEYLSRENLNFGKIDPSNDIDSFYLYEAKKEIENWWKGKGISIVNRIFEVLTDEKADRNVKIIWYAVDESYKDLDSIKIFNRLNKGKIALTNSELIKALFILKWEKTDSASENRLNLDCFIMEWNQMEKRFHDDKFWFFLSKDKECQTRMDLLFDFFTERNVSKTDNDWAYRKFQNLYDCDPNNGNGKLDTFWKSLKIKNMSEAWLKVRKAFDRLISWYEDKSYYHYIGYLVANGKSIYEIYNKIEDKRKNAGEWTKEKSIGALRQIIQEELSMNIDSVKELRYDEPEKIRKILLLFNIESYIKHDTMRFPFEKFYNKKWDIEHIDSKNDSNVLQKLEEKQGWVEVVLKALEKESFFSKITDDNDNPIAGLKAEGETLLKNWDQKKFQEYYAKINVHFGENGKASGDKDKIDNLTLLDSPTNQEYKDAPFLCKRFCIITKDKNGSCFIPMCTRNIFLKYYTAEDTSYLDPLRWCEVDKNGYMNALTETLKPILSPSEQNKSNMKGKVDEQNG